MKPGAFAYHDPATVEEVVALLARYGDGAKVLAGGQSLVPMLNMRLVRPEALVDINRIGSLAYIRAEDGWLAIGALARHADVERSPVVAEGQPLLAEAVGYVGHLAIRSRGTVCGSLAHADPAAELPAVWVCLDGRLRIAGPQGVREVGAEEFFVTYFTTCLSPEELLVEARLPLMPRGTGYAFLELARRHGDFALVAVACTLRVGPQGAIDDARIALAGVGPAPVRAREAEEVLRGERPGPAPLAEAARRVQASVAPESDVHATAEYRRHLAGVLTRRALEWAWVRALGGGER